MGRGGCVKGIYAKGMKMHTMKWAFWMDGNYGSHPDSHYNRKARPVVQGINYRDIVAEIVTMAAQFKGISGDPFTGICILNVTIRMNPKSKDVPWTCVDVKGVASQVTPRPCRKLIPKKVVVMCALPKGSLPIDEVKLKRCVYKVKNP